MKIYMHTAFHLEYISTTEYVLIDPLSWHVGGGEGSLNGPCAVGSNNARPGLSVQGNSVRTTGTNFTNQIVKI